MRKGDNMIPKKIHYCWFGRGPKGKIFKKCYNSWKKYFPDYEIIEWNEDNFDISKCKYAKQAYDLKKYAFVSDYVRLKVLYEEGGIYFDTDVEVLKKIPPEILNEGYFAKEVDDAINTGLGFAVPKNNNIIKIMLDDYENLEFIDKDGIIDMTACPERNTRALRKKGYIIDSRNLPLDSIKTYGRDYFCGYDLKNNHYIISDKTYTVHHYNASWQSKRARIKTKLKRILSKIIGIKNYEKIRKRIK